MSQNDKIREVIQPRRAQTGRGKSDTTDTYAAVRQALTEPDDLPVAKAGDRLVEQIRAPLTVRRSAIKARVAAIRPTKSLLITAPEPIRTRWAGVASDHRAIEEMATQLPFE